MFPLAAELIGLISIPISSQTGPTDGRVLVVEYKGEPYKTNDDSREKRQAGEQWERSSGGRCLFLFAVERDEQGREVAGQLAAKLRG